MLTIRMPDSLQAERTHAATLVFGALLGVAHRVAFERREDTLVSVDGIDGLALRMPDIVFRGGDSSWPQGAPSPPQHPSTMAVKLPGVPSRPLPVLFGTAPVNGAWWNRDPRELYFSIDVLGTAFWMMTRLEEILDPHRDEYERFCGSGSHAARAGYLDRPIVDETVCLLSQLLRSLWPMLQLRSPGHKVVPTHDVDRPFKHLFQTPARLLRTMVADTVRRRGAAQVLQAPSRWVRVRRGLDDADPFFTFEWLMDLSERAGLRSAFYFICGHSGGSIDGDYAIEHPRVRRLLKRIHERGHELGVHASYNTFRSAETLRAELDTMRRVCAQEGIRQDEFGGRQHVLRFDGSVTPAVWERAGLSYDSTLGYADRSGFRCGTCREFPLYDHGGRRTLRVIERPLVCMDVTLTRSRYEARSGLEARERLLSLRQACREVSGDFVLLWHNCHLTSEAEREMYRCGLGL